MEVFSSSMLELREFFIEEFSSSIWGLREFFVEVFLVDVYLIVFLNLDDVHPFKESYRHFKLGRCTSI